MSKNKIFLKYENQSYLNEHNTKFLISLGINENQSKDLLINLLFSTRENNFKSFIQLAGSTLLIIILYFLLEERNKVVFLSMAFIIFSLFVLVITINQHEINKISMVVTTLLDQQFNKIQSFYKFKVDYFCRVYAYKLIEPSVDLYSNLINLNNDYEIGHSKNFKNIQLERSILLNFNDEGVYKLNGIKTHFASHNEISTIEMLNVLRKDYSTINRSKILTMSILAPTIIIIFIALTIWKVVVAFNLKWSEDTVLVVICVSGIFYLYTIIYICISILYYRSEDKKFAEFYETENISNYNCKGIYYYSKFGLHYLHIFKPILVNENIKKSIKNSVESINSNEEDKHEFHYPDIRTIELFIEFMMS